jgi:hypothetical protein
MPAFTHGDDSYASKRAIKHSYSLDLYLTAAKFVHLSLFTKLVYLEFCLGLMWDLSA